MRFRTRVLALLVLCACRRRTISDEVPVTRAPVHGPRHAVEETARPSDELLPGDVSAFGVALPLGSTVRFESRATKMYYVAAPMNRVMRYLERRLEFHDADVHPLGAMIRGARVPDAGVSFIVDVGVRDEGDRTLVTLWDRTPEPAAPRSDEEGLRASGLNPQNGLPLPANSY